MIYPKARYLIAGDQNIVAEFGDEVDLALNQKVHNMVSAIKRAEIAGIRELIPTYRSILVNYEPSTISFGTLKAELRAVEGGLSSLSLPPPREVEVPTVYGGRYGPDIEFVAQYNRLSSVQEAIEIHTGGDYQVYMLGFTPGFTYLGGMSERIATPRLDKPRANVPAGSVGIAGIQTGIYSLDSPGGWRLIGRTPLKLFDLSWQPPTLLRAGDHVRFVSISPGQYEHISREVKEGTFEAKVTVESQSGRANHGSI